MELIREHHSYSIIGECEQPTTGGGCCNEACKPGTGPDDEGKYWCNTEDGSWDWCDEAFLVPSTTVAPTTANATGEKMIFHQGLPLCYMCVCFSST